MTRKHDCSITLYSNKSINLEIKQFYDIYKSVTALISNTFLENQQFYSITGFLFLGLEIFRKVKLALAYLIINVYCLYENLLYKVVWFFCLKLKISIITKPNEFSHLGKL